MDESKLYEFYKTVCNIVIDHDDCRSCGASVHVKDLEEALIKVSPEWFQEVTNG